MNIEAIVNERFTSLKLSQAIEKRQNEYGLLNSMGLFKEKGIAERQVKIESKDSALSIISTSPIGTPAPADDLPDNRNIRILPTFRHAKKYTLLAEEFQGVRKFGSDDELESLDAKMLEKLDLCQREYRQTKEFRRWCALKGDVYDPDGVRVLFNTYTVMGETQKVIEWDLEEENDDPIQDGTDELLDYFEENALGEQIDGTIMFCSPGYMTKMQRNKQFREAYKYFAGQPNPNRDTLRQPFPFKDILYVRHMGKCSFKKADGTIVTHKFIPDNEAIAVPMGTFETFRTFFGPAEFIETVNTEGQEIYVKPKMMDLDMGVELHSFSHALDLVTKPRLVVRCKLPD